LQPEISRHGEGDNRVGANADFGPFFQRWGSVFEVPDLSAGWLNQQRQSVAIAQHILGLLRLGGSDLGIG
jgi:hypothetical protein